MYYKCQNTVLHFNHSGYWYCFCYKYQGCERNYNRGQLSAQYANLMIHIMTIRLKKLNTIEQNLWFLITNLYAYLKRSKKIDGRENISELWDGDFQYIFRDW